jgi:hypothetical protein
VTVGSSGALVEGSHTGICGVAIGRFDYTNSMNGVAHAVQLVGMFDLPENHNERAKESETIETIEPASGASEPQ